MRKFFFILTFLCTASIAFAAHIKGGFFTYTYLGAGAGNTLRYSITLTVYMDCGATPMQIDETLNFSFYESNPLAFYSNVQVSKSNERKLVKAADDECITGVQSGCYYTVVTYVLPTVDLPANANGYTVSYQRCCRISGVDNIVGSESVGNTYSVNMPGSFAATNSSATFEVNDTAVVCANNPFTIPFSAVDPDGDELRYEFCTAWEGGSRTQPMPPTASSPPYTNVVYSNGFSGSQPLGPRVTINPVTGLISGIAPDIQNSGEYVVTVCVTELRGGVVVGSTRKELHIKVGDCSGAEPVLNPEYITCDGFTLFFQNMNPNEVIKTYYWDFGLENRIDDTSILDNPTFTYPSDSGEYTLKLVVNKGIGCTDSTEARVKIYPGFVPNFGMIPCVINPSQFIDSTTTAYGVVDSWKWDFGDGATTSDTSSNQNPVYSFLSGGEKTIRLIVTNSKGCVDTISKKYTIIQEVSAGRDTTVVVNQQLQFNATGGSIYNWSPATGLSDPTIANPVGVYDGSFDNIRYKVVVSTEEGCTDSAYITVKIFKTAPQVFVPTGFTPNNDSKNDVVRPIAAGITKIEYFRIFNRWGQLVFSTTTDGAGWDGKINGKEQATGVYAWVVKAVDYTGKEFFAKGTTTLIR
jgi:gliding motility-associated-like protein